MAEPLTGFDFEAAVTAPFRMQPGLRRLGAGARQLTRIEPGSRHQREKLAVLSAFASEALMQRPGFDAGPALRAVCQQAADEHPGLWTWDGHTAHAQWHGTAASLDGRVEQTAAGAFGLGDELARCLRQLPAPWRLPGLLCLSFAEDFAIVDACDASLPWLAVCLPSHWAPRAKLGQPLAQVHAPVADARLLVQASDALVRLVSGNERWERFVWNVTPNPRLNDHPDHHDPAAWSHTPVGSAWWRTERQSFMPLVTPAGDRQAVFAIHVQVQALHDALATPTQAQRLHDAIASMSAAVLRYRHLDTVRTELLHWLAARAAARP